MATRTALLLPSICSLVFLKPQAHDVDADVRHGQGALVALVLAAD